MFITLPFKRGLSFPYKMRISNSRPSYSLFIKYQSNPFLSLPRSPFPQYNLNMAQPTLAKEVFMPWNGFAAEDGALLDDAREWGKGMSEMTTCG
jgi:hypothetical protein